MIIDQHILDELTAQAKASPRLRMNLDLLNSPEDKSQRMLNAVEPGTVLPIHRHRDTSETVVCVRGHCEEYFFDVSGTRIAVVDLVPGGIILNIPVGARQCKDGPWEAVKEEDILGNN
jgi:cupin fold WbuC family metalloprotein